MKTSLFSLSGVVWLSFAHLLIELWRGFLDFSLVLPEEFAGGNPATLSLYGAVYTLVFAVWLVGLGSAVQGRRGGIISALLVGALFWIGVDLGTVFFYCPGGCQHIAFTITTWVALVVGALAMFGLAANLRRGSASAVPGQTGG